VRTRLADLATQAGVSTATVSRVLNGKPGVSDDARVRVLAAMDVLGYERPSSLSSAPIGLIGLIVPELTNPVFPAFAQEIETLLAARGFTPLLCTQSPGGTTEAEYVDVLLRHNVDGIVFVSGLHADSRADLSRYKRLSASTMPMVLVNGYAPDIDAPFVSPDDAASIELSLRHLLSLGHRRIGLAIGPERFVPAQRKIAAFVDLLVARGLAADAAEAATHVATSLYTLEGGQAATTELLASGHTAVICGSDVMALGALRAARSARLRVPEDLSIIGYDDSPFVAYTDPALTTVRQPVEAMCRAAVDALLSELAGDRATRTELLFAPELIVRDSTAAAPVRAG